MITRRFLLATPLFGSLAFAQEERRSLKLGDMEITILTDGVFTLPISQAYPSMTKEQLSSLAPTGTQVMNTNIVIVKTANDLCIIDTGAGHNFIGSLGKLPKRLEDAKIDIESITKVILTHAHPDHFWGALDEFNTPLFAKAKYYIHKAERDDWLSAAKLADTPDSFKNLTVGTQRILKELEPVLVTANAATKLAEGMSFIETFGHTAGHCSVLLESKGEKMLITGDAVNSTTLSFSHPNEDWGMDLNKQAGTTSRKKILEICATDKMPMIGYHFPNQGLGRVEKLGAAYRFIPT